MTKTFATFALIGIFLYSPLAMAQIGPQLKNNSAVKKYAAGDFKGGEAAINEALESEASNSVILYNWASANVISVLAEAAAAKKTKLGDEEKKRIQSAQTEFDKLLKQNSPVAKKLQKEILYQNALSLELLEKNTEALSNYYLSLAAPDGALEEAEAKKLREKTQTNIAHLLVKSQSSSSGEGGEGGGKGDEKKDPSGEGEGESKGKDGESESQKGQGQKSREPEFSGTDVNESQAQQILNSVSNQDRQVQQRKGQQQSKQNMQNGEAGEIDPRDNDKPW